MSVVMYFPSNLVEEWVKYESYGVITLFSNIGGMLGLMLGASVMTLFTLILMAMSKAVNTFFNVGEKKERKKSKKKMQGNIKV